MSAGMFLAMLAAQASASQGLSAGSGAQRHAALSPARATVTIVKAAMIPLSAAAEAKGYKLKSATITTEDGSRRPAKLVEFQ